MLFSIVIPVYNVEKYLVECLDSIVKQAVKLSDDVEILLINDGSKDASGSICEKYAVQYPVIIRYFHKENEGLLLTRRYGFEMAQGEYIVNCDSDDVMEDNELCSLKEVIEQNEKPDVVLFNSNLYDGIRKKAACMNLFSDNRSDSIRKINDSKSTTESVIIKKELVLAEFMHSSWVASMCGKTFKKSCLDFDIDYSLWGKLSTGEDTLQTIEIFDNADTFAYINKALYNYRIGSGMTGKFDPHYYDTFIDIFRELEKRKRSWKLRHFDNFFSGKVLAMTGRAITQSRYKKWESVQEHVNFLKRIREDNMFNKCINYLNNTELHIQKDHVILLYLLEKRRYLIIVIMLNVKNFLTKIVLHS